MDNGSKAEDEEHFHYLKMLQADQDEEDSNGGSENSQDENVGFENADMYDITKLFEYGSENIAVKKEEDRLVSTEVVIKN